MRYSATNFSRNGISDWLAQRVSAYVLGAYFVVVLGFIVCQSPDYAAWHAFMSHTAMKVFTLTSILALAAHAWVGIWTVLTDYVTVRQMGPKANVLRIILQTGMVFFIFLCVVWALQILWGI